MLVRVLRGLKATATARPMLRMFGSQPSHKEEHGKAVDHHDDHSSHHHEINRDKIVLRNPRSGTEIILQCRLLLESEGGRNAHR
jgi:hypothetical protein